MAAGSSLKSSLGFAFMATTLPEVSGAPASIQARMVARSASGILGLPGRHGRLLLVGDQQVEAAVVGIARLDDRAGAAAVPSALV